MKFSLFFYKRSYQNRELQNAITFEQKLILTFRKKPLFPLMKIFQINPTRFCWTVLPPIALSPFAKKYFEVKCHNIYYNGRVSSSKKYKSELFIKNQSIVVWWAGPWKHGLSKYLCIPGWGAEDFDKICKSVIEEFEKTKYKLLSNFSSPLYVSWWVSL